MIVYYINKWLSDLFVCQFRQIPVMHEAKEHMLSDICELVFIIEILKIDGKNKS